MYQSGPRGERTRERILEVATEFFAEQGYAETRLEDVAARLGMRRPSLLYYFEDKPALYEAVVDSVFGALAARIDAAFGAGGSPAERIEAMVNAWLESVVDVPPFARLMLREVANSGKSARPRFTDETKRFLQRAEEVLEAGREDGSFQPVGVMHLASAIAGATVFFVAVMPTLTDDDEFDPFSPEQIAVHRQQILTITRRLLGIGRPKVVKGEKSK